MAISNSFGKNFCSGNELQAALEKGERLYNNCSHREKDTLVRHFSPTVQRLAMRLKNRLPPHVELEELVSAGLQGLFYAFQNFASHLGVPLEAYATSRIKGAMLDELRRQDWLSRGMRKKIKQVDAITLQHELTTGTTPTQEQLVQLSGLDKTEVSQLLEASQNNFILDIVLLEDSSTLITNQNEPNEPMEVISREETIELLTKLVEELPKRDQQLLSLYYEQELTMREIAEVLDITESRVSQLHSRIIKELKKNFYTNFICTNEKK